MKKNYTLTVMLLMLSLSVTATQAENLIQNGSFEKVKEVIKNSKSSKIVRLNGWEGITKVLKNRSNKKATNGVLRVSLDYNREQNQISQKVYLEESENYRLTLDTYGIKDKSSDIIIYLDNKKLKTIIPSKKWESYSFDFKVKESREYKLTLLEDSSQNNSKGAVLDSIKLEKVTASDLDTTIDSDSIEYDVVVSKPYTKVVEINSTLNNAPEGMSINPKTGLITWTPTPNQAGVVSFDIVKDGEIVDTIYLNVKKADIKEKNIIFISPNGNNNNSGKYDAPLENTKKLCTNRDEAHPNLTIYFRGGVYHNPNFGSGDKNNKSIPPIRCSGSKNKRVTIKPWGNEKPIIEYDSAVALSINANYINVEGLEIKGIGDKITYKKAVANWWRGDRYYNGNGFAVTGHHIDIEDNIFSFVPAQSIAVKKSDYVTLKNNIVYNSAWWTIAGTNAMSINDSIAFDDANITHNKIIGNLIFGVESRIFSRVWSKGYSHLTIDEGGAILVQINDGNYTGRYLVKNNIVLFTGKGIISNKTPNVDMIHNTIYNSGTTMVGDFKGLRGNKAHNSTFKYNAVKIYCQVQSKTTPKCNINMHH